MAEKIYNSRIQLAFDTEANWQKIEEELIPKSGEFIVYQAPTGTRVKCGDGTTILKDLKFTDNHVLELITALTQTVSGKWDNDNHPTTYEGYGLEEPQGGGVESVNGLTGKVNLTPDVIGALPENGKAVTAGTADLAIKLNTGRTIRTNLGSTTSVAFDGSANITPGITGTLPVANGGTGQTTIDGIKTALGITGDSGNRIFVQSGQPTGAKQNDLWLKIL